MKSRTARRLLATLLAAQLALVGCSDDDGDEQSGEGSDTTAAAGDTSGTGLELPEKGAEGEITTTGALEGTWTPGEDLAVQCTIPPSVTLKMEDEEIFGALSVDQDGTVTFTSGELAGVLTGTGGSLEVEGSIDMQGRMTLDDVEVSADGSTMNISGSIAYGCDY